VAVVAGAAIVALVGDFTVAIIEPLIGLVLGGGVDVGVVVVNSQVFDFTLLINSIITFIITMLVIYYALVVPVNRMRRKQEDEAPPEPAEEVVLLSEIRDLLNRS
jgi:large conductance mechanosensitive channel